MVFNPQVTQNIHKMSVTLLQSMRAVTLQRFESERSFPWSLAQ